MGTPMVDVFVIQRPAWHCPDCRTVHVGECPNKVLAILYQQEERLRIIEEALEQHTDYLESIKPFLDSFSDDLRRLKKRVAKLRKEMKLWQSAGQIPRKNNCLTL